MEKNSLANLQSAKLGDVGPLPIGEEETGPKSTVLYTPTACPMDSDRLLLDPAISDGLSGQSIRSLLESVGHDWIPLLVQTKSSESPLKPLKSKKWLDWPEFCVHWTSTGLLPDFCWISTGLRQKPVIFAKSSVHWTSTGLSLDFRWTSKEKSCKRVLSGDGSHSLLLLYLPLPDGFHME